MWIGGAILGLAALTGSLVVGLGCYAFSAPGYEGERTDHFDGERFHNPGNAPEHGPADLLRWQTSRRPGPWSAPTDTAAGRPPPRRVGTGELRVTFVGHSTVLIQMDGLNILTDPMWSERASPIGWAGPMRVRPPGIRFRDLPPIDVVLISHNHYDHLDLPTLARLWRTHGPRIFVPLGDAALLAGEGIKGTTELDWWQEAPLSGDVRLVCVPAQHFSQRGTCDRNRTLWAGYVIEGPAGRVYFAGDTGYGPHFAAIRERLGPPRLALLPIGAYRPRWFMRRAHLSPADAVEAGGVLGAQRSMAIHFGTFRLGDDGRDEPLDDLAAALEGAGVARDHFWALGFGEGRDVPPTPSGEDARQERAGH